MNASDRQILEQFANTLTDEIKGVVKRFAPTVENEVNETALGYEMIVSGSPHIITLIEGRKPTSPNAKRGNTTLQEILLQWIKDKGIVPYENAKGVVPSLVQLSWAMSKSMHMKGDLLWQNYGSQGLKKDLFAQIITNDRINGLTLLFEKKYFAEVSSQILKEFN